MNDATEAAIRELFPPKRDVAPCPWCGRIAEKHVGERVLYHTPRKCCDEMRLLVGSWLLDELRIGRTKVERWLDDAIRRANGGERDATTARLKRYGAAYPWALDSRPDAVPILPTLSRHLWSTVDRDAPCVYDEMLEYLRSVDRPEERARTIASRLAAWPRLGDARTIALAAKVAAERASASEIFGPPTDIGPTA